MIAVVTGKRKREIGLLVPAKFIAIGKKTAREAKSSGTRCTP